MTHSPLSTSSLKQCSGWFPGDLRIPCLFSLAALLLAVPLAFFSDMPERDVAVRYASMAEEFAAGNWAYAFHPRIPMFHSTASGVFVWLFGVSGFTATRIVSILSYVLAVFPFYAVMKRVFNARIAAGALFLYIVNPFMLRYAVAGLRESTKCLLLIMMVHAILLIREKKGSFMGWLYLSVSSGLAMITRSEMILFSGLVLWGMMFWESFVRQDIRRASDGTEPASRRVKPSPVPIYSLVATFVADALLFFQAAVNYAMFGYPSPETRFLVVFKNMFGHMPLLSEAALIAVSVPLAMAVFSMLIVWGIPRKRLKTVLIGCIAIFAVGYLAIFFREAFVGERDELMDFLFLNGKTFNPHWSVPALLCIAVRLRTNVISCGEKILFTFIIFHTLVTTGQVLFYDHSMAFSSRYLLPVSILGFGWAFYGLMIIAGFISRSVLRKRSSVRTAMTFLLGIYAFCGLLRGFEPMLRERFSPRDSAVRLGTFRLAEIFRRKRPEQSRATPPPFNLTRYEGSAAPGVYFERTSKYCVSAYLAGGRIVNNMKHADFYVAKPRLPEEMQGPPGKGWFLFEEMIPMGKGTFSRVYSRTRF